MKENYIGKLKSLLVALIMIASALVFYQVTDNVEAATGDLITGTITNIKPTGQESGALVSGAVNITWTATNVEGHGTGPVVNYNVTFTRDESGGTWSPRDSAWFGNRSWENGNATAFTWNTTDNGIVDGIWWCNVTAAVSDGGDTQWINGTSIQLLVRNTLPGTPGVSLYQGGRYWVYNNSEAFVGHYNEIFTFSNGSMKYGDVTDITINSSLTWGGAASNTKEYYLYKPMYNGSKSGDAYNLSWSRVSNTPGKYWITGDDSSGYTISGITLDRAGLWLVNEIPASSNGLWIDDEVMDSLENYNATVWAWFWVNTSTDLQSEFPGLTNNEFLFNESGYTTQVVTEGGDAVTGTSIDITNESSGVSVRTTAQYTSTGTFDTNGGWNLSKEDCNGVGNFSGRAYVDLDYVSATNGLQYYTEYCMGSTTSGWAHYNNTYGANANKNGSSTTWSTATRYNWSMCGPWDPPEQNATLVNIRVKTREPYAEVVQNASVYYGFNGTVNVSLLERSGGSAFNASNVQVAILDDDDVNVTANFTIFNSRLTGANDLDVEQRNLPGYTGTYANGRPGWIVIHEAAGKVGWIHINMSKWGRNITGDMHPFADNGTWDVVIWVDTGTDRPLNGDGTNRQWHEEWNKTVTFKVKQAPSAQWQWVDDDGMIDSNGDGIQDLDVWGSDNTNTDGKIPYIPNATSVPLLVKFKIFDSGGNNFGDITTGQSSGNCESVRQCADNITVSGNTLFTGKLGDFPGWTASTAWYTGGIWIVPVIPTMSIGGGTITLQVSAYNTTMTRTISIGGENYDQNGSVVTVEPTDFQIDVENKTLQITAQYADDGTDIRAANSVILYYLDDSIGGTTDSMPENRICRPLTGHDISWTTLYSGGFYTLPFNTTQQTFNQTTGVNAVDGAGFAAYAAPRNLTIFVDGPGRRDGYALIQMKPVNDLEVHIEGQSEHTIISGYEYDDFTLSCDFAGNSTDTPSTATADKNNFHMKIVNAWGEDVTGTSNTDALLYNIFASRLTGSYAYSYEHDGVYGLDAGTYYIYAWNNTHNSEGNNATLIIKAVDVACDMDPFIWMSDDNISATFTITWDGSPINGTLVLDNVTDKGTYNKTWTNCSFTGSTDSGGNSSMEIDDTLINDGVVTVNDITANALHPAEAKQYITFWFKPLESPGAFARASARINVEVPTVTPDPMYIPLGRTTKVYCTATGRGANLEGVYVRLHGQGFNGSSTTDVDGRVAFSVTPATTGNISIDVGEINRTLADTVVKVVAWVIDGTTASEVDEGEDFTVTVIKEGTTDAVVGATVTIVGIGTETTDANGQATFTAPDVTSDRTYTIKMAAEGYAPDPDGLTITVINIPKLVLVLPEKPPAAASKFDVAVADDTGSPIVGAMISIDGVVYTSGANGIATITAPEKKGEYAVEVTFGNFVPYSITITIEDIEGIPGFELLSLIAALGVAFILFRRRKQ